MNEFYNKLSLDENIIQCHINKNKKIFIPDNFDKINVEIGFGNGEFLIKNAISKPNELFIGVEVYLNGIAKVLTIILNLGLKNIILCNINSIYFLEVMPYKSVDKIFIINPDPWKKKRHKKRRLISNETIKFLINIVKSKKSIYITTDSKTYLEDVVNLLRVRKNTLINYEFSILSKNHKLYGISRYQRKAIEKGGKIYLLTF